MRKRKIEVIKSDGKPRAKGWEVLGVIVAIVALIFAILQYLQSIYGPHPVDPQLVNAIGLQQTQVALQEKLVTLLAPTTISNNTPLPSVNVEATQTEMGQSAEKLVQTAAALQSQIETIGPPWSLGRLLSGENFENYSASKIKTVSGSFEIALTEDGNHVWRTSSHSASIIKLSSYLKTYAVEFQVRQVSGNRGLAGVFFSDLENNCPGFEVYLNPGSSRVSLIEKNSVCNEVINDLYRNYPVILSENVWYKVRVDVKFQEIRVYLNDQLIIWSSSTNKDLQKVDNIGILACCDDSLPYTFDFDNIRVWEINP